MTSPQLPNPSDRFKSALQIFVDEFEAKPLKDKDLPQWACMAVALANAFQAFEAVGKLELMFDTSNPFDLALLAWCAEARARQRRKTAMPSTADPSRN